MNAEKGLLKEDKAQETLTEHQAGIVTSSLIANPALHFRDELLPFQSIASGDIEADALDGKGNDLLPEHLLFVGGPDFAAHV